MSYHSGEQGDDSITALFSSRANAAAGGDGWIDIEEFNMVLTFDKFKHTDNQLGLCFAEFENMVL